MTILSTLAKNRKWGLEGPRLTKISFELLIRTDYPQHTYQNPKMRSGRLKAHQADLWHTFLIKLLIKNGNPHTPAKTRNEAWKAQGLPKWVWGHLLNEAVNKKWLSPAPLPKPKNEAWKAQGSPKTVLGHSLHYVVNKKLLSQAPLPKPKNEVWTAQGSPNGVLGHFLH